ncbi:MAG: Smr/MutS family protein [Steroidobacter sp.]
MSKLPADEINLFREAVRDVRARPATRIVSNKRKPAAIARFTRADQKEVLRESLLPVADPATLETGDELSFRRNQVAPHVLRKLRSGGFAVAAEVDLHGLNAIEARAALREFIVNALAHEFSCVRVVHGKGRRSGPRGPVLKNVVNLWLRQCDAVLAFGSARAHDGGHGAVYVLLRK